VFNLMSLVGKIVSGGQTGADRAALDFAIEHGIPHGGWCPRGRKAEDGSLDQRYQLQETPSGDYAQRTEWNVRDSDGTVVFSIAPVLTGGSKKTVFLAHKLGKPVFHISRDCAPASPDKALLRFIQNHSIKVLNVAGPRASKESEVYGFVKEVLDKSLGSPMIPPPKLESERLVLRPLNLDDAVVVARLAGSREIADMTITIPHPYSEEQARAWIATQTNRSGTAKEMVFSVAAKEDSQLVGTVGLREIDVEHSQAEMGYWIGVPTWGRGYATEAARRLVRFAFEDLKLNRVYAHHMVRNPASGRVLEKVGMKREGLLRQRVRKSGVFEDVVLLAILHDDWKQMNGRTA